jgi:hypothetical protein
VVGLVDRAVEVYTRPGPEGYADLRRVSDGTVTPALVPGLDINVAALLA